MKKKLFSFLLAIVCIACGAAAFAACGNKKDGKPATALVLGEAVTVTIDANGSTGLNLPENLTAGGYILTASGLTATVEVSVGNSENIAATLSASSLVAKIAVAAGDTAVTLTNKGANKIQFKLTLTAGEIEPGEPVFALDTELTFTVTMGDIYKLDVPDTVEADQYTIAVVPTAELEDETIQALAGEHTSGGYINASHKHFVKDGKTLWFENVYLDSSSNALYFAVISNQSKDFRLTVIISKGATDFNGESPAYALGGLNQTLNVLIPAGDTVNVTLPENLAADDYSVLISPYASIGRLTVRFTVGESDTPHSINALSGWKSDVTLDAADGCLTFSIHGAESEEGEYLIFVTLSAAIVLDETVELEANELQHELKFPEGFAGGLYTVKLSVSEELKEKTFLVWVNSLTNELEFNEYNNYMQAVMFSSGDTAIFLTLPDGEACSVGVTVVAGNEVKSETDIVLGEPSPISIPADSGFTLNLPDDFEAGEYTVTLQVGISDYRSAPVFELTVGTEKVLFNLDNSFSATVSIPAGTTSLTIRSANGNSFMISVTLAKAV